MMTAAAGIQTSEQSQAEMPQARTAAGGHSFTRGAEIIKSLRLRLVLRGFDSFIRFIH